MECNRWLHIQNCSGNYTGNHRICRSWNCTRNRCTPCGSLMCLVTDFLNPFPWAVTLLWIYFYRQSFSFVMIPDRIWRFFKLYMYTAMFPIPLAAATVWKNAKHCTFTFIKSYAGVCLEGAFFQCSSFMHWSSALPPALLKLIHLHHNNWRLYWRAHFQIC